MLEHQRDLSGQISTLKAQNDAYVLQIQALSQARDALQIEISAYQKQVMDLQQLLQNQSPLSSPTTPTRPLTTWYPRTDGNMRSWTMVATRFGLEKTELFRLNSWLNDSVAFNGDYLLTVPDLEKERRDRKRQAQA